MTSSLYQPLALAARSLAPEMIGAVLSMLTSAVSVAELPAPSLAVPVTFWPVPSVLTVASPVQLATPEPPWSAHSKVTATFWLVQAPSV